MRAHYQNTTCSLDDLQVEHAAARACIHATYKERCFEDGSDACQVWKIAVDRTHMAYLYPDRVGDDGSTWKKREPVKMTTQTRDLLSALKASDLNIVVQVDDVSKVPAADLLDLCLPEHLPRHPSAKRKEEEGAG